MRKVILAAAFAVTFTLPLAGHAQQDTSAGTQGGPPTSGSFSVQGQPQGALGGATQPNSMVGLGQPLMNTGGQPLGSALGTPQTLYGPADQTSNSGPQAQPMAAPATAPAASSAPAENVAQAPGAPAVEQSNAAPEARQATGVGGAGTAGVQAPAQTPPEVNAGSDRTFFKGPASEDPQVELARLRAEVDRLRAERDQRSDSPSMEGTGGSGSTQAILASQPVASATFKGRVSKVSKKSIEVVDHETGETYLLHVNKATRVRRGDKRASVAALREGSEVRASFDLVSGRTYAKRIDVLRKGRR